MCSSDLVAGEGGSFTPRTVVLGQDVGGTVEVLSGLTTGERIAATGSFTLKAERLKGTAPAGD